MDTLVAFFWDSFKEVGETWQNYVISKKFCRKVEKTVTEKKPPFFPCRRHLSAVTLKGPVAELTTQLLDSCLGLQKVPPVPVESVPCLLGGRGGHCPCQNWACRWLFENVGTELSRLLVVGSKNLKSPPAVGIDHRKALESSMLWKASAVVVHLSIHVQSMGPPVLPG